MMDWSVTAFKTSDLSPKKRLETLFEKAKFTHVDDGVDVKRYWDIANEILNCAKRLQKENKIEESLLNFLRYQTLIKKMRTHKRYKELHIGKRASFDYKLKEVAKNVKHLTERVSAAYKKLSYMTDFTMENLSIEGYQEQRPTISTVRTFVSTPRPSRISQRYLTAHLKRASSPARGRSRSILAQKLSSVLSMSLMKSSSSVNTDTTYGVRKSIFPTKQVREFDELHKERRAVRGHRTVVIPSRITTAFSYISLPNTKRNVETVGYLAGKEADSNALIITHLLLPKQQGYSDYFKVSESTSMVRYLEANDLMTIGWIHSHPVETPYLSSSDMHYHGIFQSVLQEAIAIVYSPKEMRSEVFNLTPEHGLKTITQCEKRGFHTHLTKYPLTMHSHHTVTDLFGKLTVEDFRDEDSLSGAAESEVHQEGMAGIEHQYNMERLLQVKSSTGVAPPVRLRQSEVNFVRLDARI